MLMRRTLRGKRLAQEACSPATPTAAKEPRPSSEPCGLLSLPSDLLELAALSSACYKDLASLASTCTAFRALSQVRRNARDRSGA